MLTKTNDEILAGYRLWLLKVAREYTDPSNVNDLAQEGHIAMWKALSTFDESKGVKLSTHLMNKARWRMAEVAQRGTWTGKPSAAGKKYSAGTSKNKGAEECVDFGMSDFDFEGVSRDEAERVMIAYHHGEIMDALSTLKPDVRKKIVDWFWRGIVDSKNRSWWDGKGYGAREKLRDQLSHMKELVNG